MAAWQADHDGIENFSLLVSHVLVPPAMEALLSSDNCVVQGFFAAGHVCTIMGFEEYFPIASKYEVPIVVTGFEPLDHSGRHSHDGEPTGRGPPRSREPIRRAVTPGREPSGAEDDRGSVRIVTRAMARPGRNSRERLPTTRTLSAIRRQPPLSVLRRSRRTNRPSASAD